jgi:uncharacterized surface protein with fasciclin (FAS1) repeats
MKKLTTLAVALAMALSAALPAVASTESDQTIVDIVLADDGEFDVLQAAVIEAGLVEALSGDAKLRVFAPTDAAFVATFEGILGGPLTEQDVIDFVEAGGVDSAFGAGALADILTYHVTVGHRRDVLSQRSYLTLNGEKVSRNELVAAGVSTDNIMASNGIINVLTEAVLLP